MSSSDYPADFKECIRFHGHLCPGLAIGYAAAVIARRRLEAEVRAEDEEIVAIVENDSCAVDAIQAMLGCTFGKGNLIFRDWGKQVFTFINRKNGKAVRVAQVLRQNPEGEERSALAERGRLGTLDEVDAARLKELRRRKIDDLVYGDPKEHFDIKEVTVAVPPEAVVVSTLPCAQCGEPVVAAKMVEKNGRLVCRECHGAASEMLQSDESE
jgi:formylmethanofuran dehydrogenase subunit E